MAAIEEHFKLEIELYKADIMPLEAGLTIKKPYFIHCLVIWTI